MYPFVQAHIGTWVREGNGEKRIRRIKNVPLKIMLNTLKHSVREILK